MNPSVTPPACQLPLTREPFCLRYRYLAEGFVYTSLREGGGLGRSPKTEGASGQETNLTTGGGTSPKLSHFLCPWKEAAWQNWHRVSVVMSKYHPKSKPSAYRPLAPSVTCGDSSLPEGAMGCVPFHMGLCLWEVPTVNPSVKNQRFLPAPFGKGAFLRPVSFHCAIPGFFVLSIDGVG